MLEFDVISAETDRYMQRRPPTYTPRPKLKVYLAGPMRGYPEFNFPAFRAAAAKLRAEGYEVFNPAEKDEEVYGTDFAERFPTGDLAAASAAGFDLRVALAEDLDWICRHADAIALLPGWQASKGACAEYSAAQALGLRAIFLEEIK